MSVTPELLLRIKLIVNHVCSYAEILYTDAILLNKKELADQIRIIVSETSEINRIIGQPIKTKTEGQIIESAIKQEIARHCYISQYVISQIPNKLLPEEYAKLEGSINVVASELNEAIQYFEDAFNITTKPLEDIPITDLLNASDFSLSQYISDIPGRTENTNSGIILFAGKNGRSSSIIRKVLTNAGFRTIFLTENSKVFDTAELYNISLICFDCESSVGLATNALKSLIENPKTSSIPVLICSDSVDVNAACECIKLGAIGYFTPESNLSIVLSRIQAAIKTYFQNHRKQLYIRALELNQSSTNKELASASSYVQTMLSPPFQNDYLKVDWVFMPSLELGGDVFGYDWFSPTEFAIVLLDVSGHGIEASLFSVTVLTLLKKRLLKSATSKDPAKILTELNSLFDMETQNNMFFTAWVGFYNTETRKLTYCSAGSQPAILFDANRNAERLTTNCTIIGIDEDSTYTNSEKVIEPNSKLYIFSDGIYEVKKTNGTMLTLNEFHIALQDHIDNGKENCRQFAHRFAATTKGGQFDDDVSLIEMSFK